MKSETLPTMREIEHEVTVCASWQKPFELCAQVGHWPNIMPAVRQARRVEVQGPIEMIEITAEAGNQLLTWRSRREIDRQGKRIKFWRLNPKPPLAHMEGEWCFEPVGPDLTRITLRHRYKLNEGVTNDEIFQMIRNNSTRDLEALKETIERGWCKCS